jgi:hypothetical protein
MSPPTIQINLTQLLNTLSLPQVPTSPKEQHDRQRKVRLEEALSIINAAAGGRDGGEELRDQRDDDEHQTDPGAGDAENMLERDVIERAAVGTPGGAEAYVRLQD